MSHREPPKPPDDNPEHKHEHKHDQHDHFDPHHWWDKPHDWDKQKREPPREQYWEHRWQAKWRQRWQEKWQRRMQHRMQRRFREQMDQEKQKNQWQFPPRRGSMPGMHDTPGELGRDPRGWPRRFNRPFNPGWGRHPGWRPPPEFAHDYTRELRQNPEWIRRQRHLFGRFVVTFGLFMLIIVGGIGMLAWLFTTLFGGNGQAAVLTWIGGCGVAIVVPILGIAVARRASRDITNPLADVITAADSVAKGNLTVRVRETAPGEFGRLSQTFNRMVGELQRIDEQRKNLTADVAHELRTPLHIIQGNLEGLLDGVYQPTKEHIEMLLEETQLLSRLIEDLRTLAQAEAGHLPLHKEQVPIAELLNDLGTSFSMQAESAGIGLKVDVQSVIGTIIEADVLRLNQVLANLIVNALRHTPTGGMITLTGQIIPGGVRMRVSDTGYGISPDDLPHIFDRFWRGDAARTHKDGAGGGLGLAIVKQLVELHGGQISVQSYLGQGTIFTIDLPERLPDLASAAPQ
jgi:signal transduction histidine kinase